MIDKKNIASIQITRTASGKSNIVVTMPVWFRKDDTGRIYINLALFGSLITYVDSESEIDTAISEVLLGFFQLADEGKGFRAELSSLGWKIKKNNFKYRLAHNETRPKPMTFGVESKEPFNQVMHTGVSKKISLQVA